MHYANGREAKVGDRVVGRTYNTKGLVAGTLVSVTPGRDQCSAKVGFLKTFPIAEATHASYDAAGFVGQAEKIVAIQGTEEHGNYGALAVTKYAEDFTHCANLLHADDVPAAGALLAAVA